MDTSAPDFKSLAARIEKLERQNRWFKRAGIAVVLSGAAIVGMRQARPSRALEAQSFVLRDSSGVKSAELTVLNSAPTLRFLDNKGAETMYLSPLRFEMNARSGLGPNIFLDDEGGFPRVSLGLDGNRPAITVNDAQGFATQIGSITSETTRTGEVHVTSAASLTLLGNGGKVLWSAP